MDGNLTGHPVVALLLERRESGSVPGKRTDGFKVALVVEGGGMRGAYSAGMIAGLEQFELRDAFDDVYGASAGALNAAYFLSRQAVMGATMYYEDLSARAFINPYRALLLGLGGPVVRMEYALDYLYREVKPLDVEAVLSSPVPLHVVATDVETGEAREFTSPASWSDLRAAFLASTRVPFVAGAPISIDGRRYVDASLSASIPYKLAVSNGATHLLILRSRRHDAPPVASHGPERWLMEAAVRSLNPRLIAQLRARPAQYKSDAAEIRQATVAPREQPFLCAIEPSLDAPRIHQLSRSRELAESVVRAGLDAARQAFGATTGSSLEATA